MATVNKDYTMHLISSHEFNNLGHLDLGENPTGRVVSKRGCVTDGKGVRSLDTDFAGLDAVQLLHALDLGEGDKVSILQTMPCFVESGDQTLAILLPP